MRYYTLEMWLTDQRLDVDNPEGAEAAQLYAAHLERIRGQLPAELNRLFEQVCIHDARLLELSVDIGMSTATLRLAAGDRTMRESRHVRLIYGKLLALTSLGDTEKGLPGSPGFGDIGFDEVDVLESGVFEHRLLFSSGLTLELRFGAFAFEVL